MAVAVDPVCGMDVEIETATFRAEYRGTGYYFCGRGCLLDFEEDPESFLDPGHLKSMDDGDDTPRDEPTIVRPM